MREGEREGKREEGRRQETRAEKLRESPGLLDSEVSGGRSSACCQLVSLSAHARWHRGDRAPRVDSHTNSVSRHSSAPHSHSEHCAVPRRRHALLQRVARYSVCSCESTPRGLYTPPVISRGITPVNPEQFDSLRFIKSASSHTSFVRKPRFARLLIIMLIIATYARQ